MSCCRTFTEEEAIAQETGQQGGAAANAGPRKAGFYIKRIRDMMAGVSVCVCVFVHVPCEHM